jgi:hypothetical protein
MRKAMRPPLNFTLPPRLDVNRCAWLLALLQVLVHRALIRTPAAAPRAFVYQPTAGHRSAFSASLHLGAPRKSHQAALHLHPCCQKWAVGFSPAHSLPSPPSREDRSSHRATLPWPRIQKRPSVRRRAQAVESACTVALLLSSSAHGTATDPSAVRNPYRTSLLDCLPRSPRKLRLQRQLSSLLLLLADAPA